MSETINNLVSAIASGNALDTEEAFAAAMAEKLGPKLDDMRQSVAKNMFRTPEAMDQETEVETEQTVEEE